MKPKSLIKERIMNKPIKVLMNTFRKFKSMPTF